MKLVLVESNEGLRELYSQSLRDIYDEVELIELSCPKDAIVGLADPSIDGYIVSFNDMNHMEFVTLYRNVIKRKSTVPFISLSARNFSAFPSLKEFHNNKNCYSFILPIEMDIFCSKVGELVYNRDFKGVDTESDFIEVNASTFLMYNFTSKDIFVRVSGTKFVKILNGGNEFSYEDIKNYLLKGVKVFHLKNDDNIVHGALEECHFLKKLESTKISISGKRESLNFRLKMYGIEERALSMASSMVEESMEVFNTNDVASVFMENFRIKINEYICDHSYYVALFSCAILKYYKSTRPSEVSSLCAVGLFHDVCHNNEYLAKLSNFGVSKVDSLPIKLKMKYLECCKESIKFLKSKTTFSKTTIECAKELEEILLVMPGSARQAVGGNSDYIKIFVIAHRFVDLLYENQFASEKKMAIIQELKENYQGHDYMNIIGSLTACHVL